MVLLQAIITYVFFERDLDTTTRRMARDVAADVALLVALEDSTPTPERDGLRALAARQLQLPTSPSMPARRSGRRHHGRPTSTIDMALDDILASSIGPRPRISDHAEWATISRSRWTCMTACWRCWCRATASPCPKPDIFILWMVGSALILVGVAILFLRNQVRPIERLARAAESFGKGRPVPDFKPYGATEVRRAAQAFITMRERIERHVNQRTEMLAGVSHDLKTPLTRMKLALAMMHDDADTARHASADIAEMEHMLDEYLAFARGEGGEESAGHRSGRTGARRRRRRRQGARRRARIASASRRLPACHLISETAGAAPLHHQSDRQCPEAGRAGGGDA